MGKHDKSPITSNADGNIAALLAVADTAKAWWESKRPSGWTEHQHLLCEQINATSTDREKDLAHAVAEWVKLGG